MTVSERIGEYRIVRELTRTAAALTYEAVHAVLPRRAVVKVMASPTHRLALRALREAIYLDSMDHPGVPRLYESARLPDRRAWFARELIEGPSIASLFAHRPIATLELLDRLRDIAEVLAHAHGRGIVHGCLRPEHVLLARRPHGFVLCIADWSDARAHDAQPTPFVAAPGAWHYAAPEVVSGEAVDDRADVFSLGVMAYKLLTGNLPFERGAIQMRNEGEVPTPARQLAAEAPPELCAIIDQMLAYDRFDRPNSTEVFKDLSWLGEMLASARMRIRNPRWTPQVELEHPEAIELVTRARTQPLQHADAPTALEAALRSLAEAEVDDEYAELSLAESAESAESAAPDAPDDADAGDDYAGLEIHDGGDDDPLTS